MSILSLTHPEYFSNLLDWEKWRVIGEGGTAFINKYLQKYTERESDTDFNSRKTLTYSPACAKAAIRDIKNAWG